jgi:hypothetical protein
MCGGWSGSAPRYDEPAPRGNELMAMRAVSKTVNLGSNPSSPAQPNPAASRTRAATVSGSASAIARRSQSPPDVSMTTAGSPQ